MMSISKSLSFTCTLKREGKRIYKCLYVGERGRDRERERQREGDREREKERERDRKRRKHKRREIERVKDSKKGR